MARLGKAVKGVLLDLSGTVHIDDTATRGAVSAIHRLRAANVPLRFVTNTTKESRRSLVQRLVRIGFDITEDEVFTSLTAARRFVESRRLRPFLLLQENAKEDFHGIEESIADGSDADAVLVGLSPDHFNYATLTKAFRILLKGCPLIAVHKARYYRCSDGLALGPGPFVTALEYASDTVATVIGKPQKDFFLSAVDGFCRPEEAVMIGDDVRDDVIGASNAGLSAVLVRTGKYCLGDEKYLPATNAYVCDDLADAVDKLLNGSLV